MAGSRAPDSSFEIDALPFGVVAVDRDGTITAYDPFAAAMPQAARDRLIGRNFFKDVAPHARLRRFHERFATFVALRRRAVEPFEFAAPGLSGEHRVTMLFVRDEAVDERVSILLMRNGQLA